MVISARQPKFSNMSEESEEDYSYSDYSNYSAEEESEEEEEEKDEAKERVILEEDTSIELECGTNGQIKIIPGPANSFNIKFTTTDQGKSASIELNIQDGECKINADDMIIANQDIPVEKEKPTNDPALLYEFRKL